MTSAEPSRVIAQSRNIARTTEPIATNAAKPPKMIQTVSMPPDSAAIPSAKPPMHTTTTMTQRAEGEPGAASHQGEEAVDGSRGEVLDPAVGGIVVVGHDVCSVPRQTGRVIPDPAAIDESARDHVIVEGPDALSYLHSQVAQDLNGLGVGATTWTLVLEPTGKVESLARVTRTADDRFDFDTDAGFGEALAARLNRFKIRVEAEVSVEPATSPEPSRDHEAARIAAGWPRMGFEIIAGETIPAVTGVVPLAVNFTKGCYPGQELVERMDSRGADAPEVAAGRRGSNRRPRSGMRSWSTASTSARSAACRRTAGWVLRSSSVATTWARPRSTCADPSPHECVRVCSPAVSARPWCAGAQDRIRRRGWRRCRVGSRSRRGVDGSRSVRVTHR